MFLINCDRPITGIEMPETRTSVFSPRLGEPYGVYAGKNVYPARSDTDLENNVRSLEVFLRYIVERHAERSQSVHNLLCVLSTAFDPEVYIPCGANLTIRGHSISANEQIPNVLL